MRRKGRRTIWGSRGRFRLRAASTRRCIEGGCGPCGRMPVLRMAAESNAGLSLPALGTRSDRPVGRVRSADATRLRFPIAPQALSGEVGKAGVAIAIRSKTWRRCSTAFRSTKVSVLDDDQRAGFDPSGALSRGRTAPRHSVRQTRRYRAERYAQRIRGPRHLHLSAGTSPCAW